ncbi:unnamed protein product [Auanema sp. JU1783]|nr:unnamed protein product [Auanema sp. JU1783]
MKIRAISILLLAFLNLSHSLLSEEEVTLTIKVDAGKIECLFLPVRKPSYRTIELNYIVAKGGQTDIDLNLKKPNGQFIVDDKRSRTSSHRLDITPEELGDYILCMDNSFSLVSAKTIAISFYLLDGSGNYISDLEKINSNPAMEVLIATQVFETTTTQIKLNLNRIENELNQIRSITYKDRSRVEDTFESINFWGIINTIYILLICVVQVTLVRSLLTDNSSVGKLLRKGFKSD